MRARGQADTSAIDLYFPIPYRRGYHITGTCLFIACSSETLPKPENRQKSKLSHKRPSAGNAEKKAKERRRKKRGPPWVSRRIKGRRSRICSGQLKKYARKPMRPLQCRRPPSLAYRYTCLLSKPKWILSTMLLRSNGKGRGQSPKKARIVGVSSLLGERSEVRAAWVEPLRKRRKPNQTHLLPVAFGR